jgi:hypothetical protein
MGLCAGFCEAQNAEAAEGDELVAELKDERLRAALATANAKAGEFVIPEGLLAFGRGLQSPKPHVGKLGHFSYCLATEICEVPRRTQ